MYRKYFLSTVIICLVLTLGIVIFNWLINPYSLFDRIELKNWNSVKPAADLNERLSKAYEVIRLKPVGLILGNSRALAIPTTHAGWSHKNNYNLALSSGSMHEALRYFQHASSTHTIKQVVLSVTFGMFIPGTGYPPQYNDKRLMVDIHGHTNHLHYLNYLNDIAASTLSLDAARASIKTIATNRTASRSSLVAEQATECYDPYKDHIRIKQRGGHEVFFLETNKALIKNYWKYRNASKTREQQFANSLKYFTKLIRMAYQQDIQLNIIIPPGHALLYEAWHITGLWPLIEKWKKSLIDINDQAAHEFNKKVYPIWDFSDYNSITTETVPVRGDSDTPMKWFWETLHFKDATARLILDKVFNQKRKNCMVPGDFGIRISKKNISQHLQAIHKSHKTFQAKYPVHINDLKTFATIMNQRTKAIDTPPGRE